MAGRTTIGARRAALIAHLFLAGALAACTAQPNPPPAATSARTAADAPANARAMALQAAPVIDFAALDGAMLARAAQAFRASCAALTARDDTSGLTRAGDWAAACAAAAAGTPPARLFAEQFRPLVVGDGAAFATGYFEPEIAGSRTRGPGYGVPVYRVPPDLIEADLGRFADSLKGRRIRGRVEAGQLIPYPDRAAIDAGALAGRGLEIAWAADAVDLFFLQIQGSGRLRAPDGSVMRIGYAGQNGRDYVAIGRLLRERGVFGPGQATMAAIQTYLRADAARGRALMAENPSYVFFRELTGPGPLGAMGVAVTPRASVAADPAFVPLGAPVLLTLDDSRANGVWIAQDTGGAIKGANRFDTFWGAGAEAGAIAGGLSAKGNAVLLLPIAAAERLIGSGPTGTR